MSYLQERSAGNVMGARAPRARRAVAHAPASAVRRRLAHRAAMQAAPLPHLAPAPAPAPASLKALMPAQCTVLRDGAATKVDAQDLVPGDIVSIRLGDRCAHGGRAARVPLGTPLRPPHCLSHVRARSCLAPRAPVVRRAHAACVQLTRPPPLLAPAAPQHPRGHPHH